MKSFDLNSCRSKLEDHYQKTATVPTSVWSQKSVVDIHQIYTRLSWVKEEQTPAGTTQSELKHYTDLFTANKSGVIPKRILVQGQTGTNRNKHQEQRQEQTPAETTQSELKHYTDLFTANKSGVIPKRILVQGQTGIGKSTFVKKLLVDWVEVNKKTGDEQATVLKNFELVVAVNLKEVSKCQSLKEVIRLSSVFAKEDKHMTEGLVDYISKNQEKVLLIFDGYDEYRIGRNSEIYEIFSGNSLRSCCVLITTRISRADELRGGAARRKDALYAEITGFSEVDRKDFMRRFLDSEEVSKLQDHLKRRKLDELAKVPLLLLFFCTLWKREQSKHFPKTKTSLYMAIVQFIFDHSQSEQSLPQYDEVASFKEILSEADKTKTKQYVELKSYKEILSEIGKVALQGLLKDDHLFEYSQLSDSVRCDESVFIGLLQITDYTEAIRPVGMVSFIHKSIQEFLAAWYITYRCITEDGELAEIGVKFEECMALEDVFPFVCGLSHDGALATFRHLKSVRMSDPALDLSKTVPDEGSEADAPLSDVTDCQRKFSDLVSTAFEEGESKAELSRACLDSLGSILLVSESFPDYLLVDAIDTNTWSLVSNGSQTYFRHRKATISRLYEIVKKLITEGSEVLKVAEFLEKFVHVNDGCDFSFVLCFRNGQVYLYITHLTHPCENHVRLITDNVVSSHSVHQSSGQLSLEFLKTLDCCNSERSMKSLGAAIKNCNHLEHIVVSCSNNSLSQILNHVPNPRRCSLSIEFSSLTSKGAVELASLLPKFERVIRLSLSLAECSAEAVTKLVTAIKHKSLEELELSDMNLTIAAAEALGQSLSELSALQTLKIDDVTLCPAEAGKRLFSGIKHRTLKKLELSEINLTTAAAEALGQSLSKLSALQTLSISGMTLCSAEAGTKSFAGIKHKTLEELELREMNLTTAAAEALGQSLPELSALRTLTISGVTLCSAEAGRKFFASIKPKTLEELELREMNLTTAAAEALGQSLPELSALRTLTISGVTLYSAEAGTRLVTAIKHKTLKELKLSKINLTSAAVEALGQSLSELSALETLEISDLTEWTDGPVTKLVAAIKHKTLKKLELSTINLTSVAAESLGQSLPELSALKTLEIGGLTECSDEAVTKLVSAIKQKTLKKLGLTEMNLTSAAAVALGQSLSELPSLQNVMISGSDGCSLQLRCLLLRELKISGVTEFSLEAVTRLIEVLRPKPHEKLELSNIHLTSGLAEALSQLLPELSALQTLEISGVGECSDDAVTKFITAINHQSLEELELSEMKLTSAAAEALGMVLPELSALQTLKISGLTECSDEVVTKLVSAIKHKTLKELELSEMSLRSTAGKALVQSLSELPSLQKLKIIGSEGCSLQVGFPVLLELDISDVTEFSVEAVTRLIDVIKLKPLEKLELSNIYLTSAIAEALGQLLSEVSALQALKISGVAECSDEVVTKLVTAIKHKSLEELELSEIKLTTAAAEALGQALPELSALRTLKVSGSIECSDEAATRLGAVIKHRTLEELDLSQIHLTSAVAESLGQSLPGLSALRTLKIRGLIKCSDDAVTRLVAAIKHKTLEELTLSKINPTSPAAVILGQSLPELHFLQRLKISGSDGFKLHLRFPVLRELKISGVTEFSAEVVTRLVVGVIKGNPFKKLELSEINLTSAVAEGLGQLLHESSALQILKINCLTEWSDGAGAKFFAALKHKTLKELDLSEINVTPAATEALGQSLPELSALQTLKISGLTECSDEVVTKLVSAIKHKTLEDLKLSEINLTSAAAVVLVQSLSELPSLQNLTIDGLDGCNLHLRLSVLPELKISGLTEFSAEAVTRLIDIIKNKPFEKLELSEINLTSAVAEALGQLLPELSALQTLEINGLTEWSDGAGTIFFAAFKHKTLKELDLSKISVMSAATEALGQSLPELSALRSLKISGLEKCRLKQKEVEALFGRFNRPSSIKELWFTGFTARGSLAPLVKNLCLFPCLKVLKLEDLDMGEADLSDLLENLKFTPDLESLHLSGNPLGHAVRSMIPCLLEQQKLQMVYFWPGDCSEEDLKYVQEAVKEKRPRLRIETWFWQDE